MRFIPAVSLVRIQLPLPKGGPMVKRSKTPPFHGGNTGSIPVRVTIFGRIAQLVRALASHARGRRFESVCAHQQKDTPVWGVFFSIEKERTRTAGSISDAPRAQSAIGWRNLCMRAQSASRCPFAPTSKKTPQFGVSFCFAEVSANAQSVVGNYDRLCIDT